MSFFEKKTGHCLERRMAVGSQKASGKMYCFWKQEFKIILSGKKKIMESFYYSLSHIHIIVKKRLASFFPISIEVEQSSVNEPWLRLD